jgi:hypothetical protein
VKRLPVLLALLALACGGGGSGGSNTSGSSLPKGPGVFTASPIEVEKITDLEPLGAMNPVGHTIPTDHVYFYFAWCPGCPPQNPVPVLPIVAPGAGTVTWILQQAGLVPDFKVMIQMTGDFYYYVDHVILDPGIQVGTKVTAGQRLGSSNGIAMDLGVMYEAVTLTGFVNPARYAGQTLHTDSPFKYFSEPLKSQLYARVRRNAPDKDGKIDYDVRGRLIGNWFHESVAIADSMGPSAWPKQLAFCPDSNEPSQMRISIGGTVAPPGKWKPAPGDPDPAQVSVATGKVAYHLKYTDSGDYGLMLVQLLDDTRIRVQVFPGSTAPTGEFDGNALIYTR